MGQQQNSNFEVFISYRRNTGAQVARTLYYALKSIGVKAFFDYNSIRNGKFNDAIYDAIDQADCFILLLTPTALDRCVQDENDWVRKEIEYAITSKKQIIPVSPTNQGVVSNLPPVLPPLMEEALRNLQISRLDTEDLFVESLYKIISDRFPRNLCARHPNLFYDIYPEKLANKSYVSEQESKEETPQNENADFKYRLWNAIDSFKISIYEYLVKDFLADLHKDGVIRIPRQYSAFEILEKLLMESECYLSSDEYSQTYTLCSKYLADTFNDFFSYVRALKDAGKNASVSELIKFISSRMDEGFYAQYNLVKNLLCGNSQD